MNTQINQLLDTFQGFRMPALPGDEYETKGRAALAEKISPFVAAQKPIEFVMLGYPVKSANDRDKVLGKLPDRGEEVSMQNFAAFAGAMQAVYQPGVNIAIVSDGYAFNNILEIPDSTVAAYNEMAREMAKVAPITWYEMFDFYNKAIPLATMRQKTAEQFGISPEELERRVLLDADVNSLYRGMIRFMEEDLAMRQYNSRNQLHKEAKRVGREMMLMNEAYSALIRSNFPNHVRLSMHPSINNGSKYSFQLIPSPEARQSPWHSALLLKKNGIMATVHKKDALAAGCELVFEDGRPYYFAEN